MALVSLLVKRIRFRKKESRVILEKHTNSHINKFTFLEVIIFLKSGSKTIFIYGFIGLVVSSIYLLITPSLYKAVASVSVATVVSPGNQLGIKIEEPASLVKRLSISSNFDAELLKACNLNPSEDATEGFKKYIKISIPKVAPSTLQIEVTRPSRELAKACANSFYQLIFNTQMKEGELLIMNSAAKKIEEISKLDKRLNEDRLIMLRERNSGSISQAYIVLHNQIRVYEDRLEVLRASSGGERIEGPALNTPIYIDDKADYPPRLASLLVGLLGGILLGFFATVVSKLPKLAKESDKKFQSDDPLR
jgi:hypothetical protein